MSVGEGFTCPLCGKDLKGDGFTADEHQVLGGFLPGLPNDYLSEGDPAREVRGRTVHWDCYAAWPERERVAKAHLDWFERTWHDWPEMAAVTRSPDLFLAVTLRFDRKGSRVTYYLPDSGDMGGFNADDPWKDSLGGLERQARNAHPFHRASLLRARDELRSRFSNVQAILDAADWTGKLTRCAICERALGLPPSSEEAYLLPTVAHWPPSTSLGDYRERPAHTSCYLAWDERPRFVRTLVDADRRLAKPTPKGCAYADDRVQILLEKEIAWRDAQVRLLETGTHLSVRAIKWSEWSADPMAFHPGLRAFERRILEEILPALRARFPNGESLAAAVDWTRRENEFSVARAALTEACRLLEPRARCPVCAGALQLVQGPRFRCGACKVEREPMELGCFPE